MGPKFNTLCFAAAYVGLVATLLPQSVQASDYPDRPIRWIVPYAPGSSGTNSVTRLVADGLKGKLSQTVVVENRAGANGTTGSGFVAKSKPDGYTLLAGAAGAITLAPFTSANLQYESYKDFTPIAMLANTPFVMVVSNAVPAKDLKEFIALAKAQPGKLKYASTGTGGSTHLAGEMLKKMAGIDIVHVPYTGTGVAMPDLIAGRVDMFISSVDGLLEFIKTDKVRAIAGASLKRSRHLPELPTADEQGLAGFDTGGWVALLGPANMPHEIVKRLYQASKEVVEDLDAKNAFVGPEPFLMDPAKFEAYLKDEAEKMGSLIKEAGIEKQ